jgi:hypothetical protein
MRDEREYRRAVGRAIRQQQSMLWGELEAAASGPGPPGRERRSRVPKLAAGDGSMTSLLRMERARAKGGESEASSPGRGGELVRGSAFPGETPSAPATPRGELGVWEDSDQESALPHRAKRRRKHGQTADHVLEQRKGG